MNVELILVHRIVELPHGAGDLRGKQQEQHDVGDVHLPGAQHQPLGGGEKMAAAHDRAVDVAGQIARNEHEELGGIAEAVVAQRQPGHDVVRNVIEEDHPQPDAAEKIEPEVALDRTRERSLILIGHHAPPVCPVRNRVRGSHAALQDQQKLARRPGKTASRAAATALPRPPRIENETTFK